MSMYFGEQLRKLRLERRLTQRELAALVGLSQAQISLHEKGVDLPGSRLWPLFAQALGIPLEEMEDLIHHGKLKEFLRASTVLSSEVRRSIEDYVDFAWERDRQARSQRQEAGEAEKPEG